MDTDIQSLFEIAEVELIYRKRPHHRKRPVLNSSAKAYDVLKASWDDNKIELLEQFKVLLLDNASRCLGISEMGTGGIDYVSVDFRLLFATALKARATSLILAHNHPSGNPRPSTPDIQLTEKSCEAAKLLGLKVHDHIIIGNDQYYSFADNGMMPL